MNQLPTEVAENICSHLSFSDLLNLQASNKASYHYICRWASDRVFHLKSVYQFDVNHIHKLEKNQNLFIKIVDFGCIIISLNAYGMFEIKTRFVKVLNFNHAITLIIENDPYSFQVRQKPFPDMVFSKSLRDFLENSLNDDHDDSDCSESSFEQCKRYLYPLKRSHLLVACHLHQLLKKGAILKTIVDGTVGIMPDDDYNFDFYQNPHWQQYSKSNDKIILIGEDYNMTFPNSESVINYLGVIQTRWIELYSNFTNCNHK
jgi:hypothetical protein